MEDHEQLHCFGHWRDGRDRHAHHPLAGRAGANGSRRRPRCRPSNAEFAGQFSGRPLTLDVTDAGSIAAAAAAIPDSTSCGISLDTETRVTETDVEAFRRTYQTNVFGVVAVTNACLAALRRSAHPRIVTSPGTGSLTWSTGPNPQFDYQAAGTGSGPA